jgi:hypothetical protein
VATAREAYAEAARLGPSSPEVQAALRRMDTSTRARAMSDPFGVPGEGGR